MSFEQFEKRKQDHIRLALDKDSQSSLGVDWGEIDLSSTGFPEIDFSDVILNTMSLGKQDPSPFFISSMTAGHANSMEFNKVLAEAAETKGWLLGVGSQRRELTDHGAEKEWAELRRLFPRLRLGSNLGLSQVIQTPVDRIADLVEKTQSELLFVHTNPLQECIQPEGTPHFRGGLSAVEKLVATLKIPIVVKEVGCGISADDYRRLSHIGVSAVDVSGRGGTHWGRIESQRSPEGSRQSRAGETFKDFGIPTPKALFEISKIREELLSSTNTAITPPEVWASGGIVNGLQACRALAMGADRVGMARIFLQAATRGTQEVLTVMEQLEYELKVAMFCLGLKSINEFKIGKVWTWELK